MIVGFNRVIAEGNLGKDAELKPVGNDFVLSFSIGANEKWKNKDGEKQERVEWFNCSLWGKRAEALAKFLKKGNRVLVEGKLRTDKYEKNGETRYATKVIVSEVVLLDGKKSESKPDDGDDMGNGPDSIPF